jgi:hypothetical protein
MLFGVHPPPHLCFSSKSFQIAYQILGAADDRAEAKLTREDKAPWAFGADGGTKGGRAMNMIAKSVWNFELGKPRAEPLACSDLHRDQSAKNATATCERAFARAGLDPALCCAGISDGADAATQEIGGALDGQHEKSGRSGERLSMHEYCCIHGIALEENAGLDAMAVAMGRKPGMLVDGLRLLWEIIAGTDGRSNEYRQIWVGDCFLPLAQYEVLAKMAEPTASKWQIMFEICSKLLPLFEPISNPVIDAALMPSSIEKFFDRVRALHCGSVDETKATRTVHPHRDKLILLTGLVSEISLHGSMCILVDVWEACYQTFYTFCKSPSRYGNFEQPHLRHMMAEQSATVTVFYAEARADPKKFLPRLYKLTSSSRRRAFAEQLDVMRRGIFEKAGAAFLEAAAAKHDKWNGTTWTRPRHLLGLLCIEQRRAAFASELLELMGEGDALEVARKTAAAIALGAGLSPPPAKPTDAISRLLHEKLRVCHADGTLGHELDTSGLRSLAVVHELLLLATVPQRITEVNPVLSKTETPRLYTKFISMLFVGFAHNLLLESYVSRFAQLEKTHKGCHALTIDRLFMYRARGTREKSKRLECCMRSMRGGGRRFAATVNLLAGKLLKGSACRSKSQQKLMCEQAEARAAKYANAGIRKRGIGSIAAQLRSEREAHDAEAARVARVKVASMRATHLVTATGRARHQPLSAIACRAALPTLTPGLVQKAGRGNQFKDQTVMRAGLAALRERGRDAANEKTRLARKRPMNQRQRVVAERLPVGVTRGAKPTKRTKRAAAELAAGTYAGCDDDGDGGDDDFGGQLSDDGSADDDELFDETVVDGTDEGGKAPAAAAAAPTAPAAPTAAAAAAAAVQALAAQAAPAPARKAPAAQRAAATMAPTEGNEGASRRREIAAQIKLLDRQFAAMHSRPPRPGECPNITKLLLEFHLLDKSAASSRL